MSYLFQEKKAYTDDSEQACRNHIRQCIFPSLHPLHDILTAKKCPRPNSFNTGDPPDVGSARNPPSIGSKTAPKLKVRQNEKSPWVVPRIPPHVNENLLPWRRRRMAHILPVMSRIHTYFYIVPELNLTFYQPQSP